MAADIAPVISDGDDDAETVQTAETAPEKPFIGTSISGAGYVIHFDGIAGRTRLVFDHAPTAQELALTERFRFFYSPVKDCYIKKLTFKAYRAALGLSAELDKLRAVKGGER